MPRKTKAQKYLEARIKLIDGGLFVVTGVTALQQQATRTDTAKINSDHSKTERQMLNRGE